MVQFTKSGGGSKRYCTMTPYYIYRDIIREFPEEAFDEAALPRPH